MCAYLFFQTNYLPGFKAGGPVTSLSRLVARLSHLFEFSICTRDRDLNDDRPYSAIDSGVWYPRDSAKVIYMSPGGPHFSQLKEMHASITPDVVYLNSLFSFHYSIKPLLYFKFFKKVSPRLILAPRGELGRGALSIKAGKKRVFLTLAKLLSLHKRVLWHATSSEERRDIEREFRNSVVFVAENFVGLDSELSLPFVVAKKQAGTLRCVFCRGLHLRKI